ncbi:metalloregulator ArsR/SmtB family transcription factor [Dactylosporangium sp. NPDC049140]|uniref:ArsR/SmtB family transcription factor n=1 Tax=Dactylosporangium sp. NPDC049140 TaxID=3155647 RepID=UPI0033EB1AC1
MTTPSADRFEQVSMLFRALAAPVRLAIVELLVLHYELQVHEIVAAVGVTQALISQHLRVLRQARLVVRIQDGRRVTYRLRSADLSSVVGAGLAYYDEPS